jgi:hypothetical protein
VNGDARAADFHGESLALGLRHDLGVHRAFGERDRDGTGAVANLLGRDDADARRRGDRELHEAGLFVGERAPLGLDDVARNERIAQRDAVHGERRAGRAVARRRRRFRFGAPNAGEERDGRGGRQRRRPRRPDARPGRGMRRRGQGERFERRGTLAPLDLGEKTLLDAIPIDGGDFSLGRFARQRAKRPNGGVIRGADAHRTSSTALPVASAASPAPLFSNAFAKLASSGSSFNISASSRRA